MHTKNKYWHDLVNKHLVGRTIIKAQWLIPDEAHRLLMWDYQPLELFLDNGTIITPSCDDEGNNAGALFTTVKELPCCPVFRDAVCDKEMIRHKKEMEQMMKEEKHG